MSDPAKRLFRFPGVQPFSGAQKDIFFGRDNDREALLSLVLLERLVVLFGKSGYGKSSLLNAGLAPDLLGENRRNRRVYVPVFVRFNAYAGHEAGEWLDTFTFHLDRQTPPLPAEEQAARAFLPHTLWGELKRRHSGPNEVFVLIFDQFEELFTYPKAQQEAFKHQLADLLYASIPEYVEQHEDDHTPEEAALMTRNMEVKSVLSIRADRLSELDRLKDKLPVILHKRYELRSLTPAQAREALEKPAALPDLSAGLAFLSPAFDWQPGALEKILSDLSRDNQGRNTGGIEAFQLQILAQNIENRVTKGEIVDHDGNGRPDVTVADLPAVERLYEDFYENALQQLSATERKKTRRLVEEGLIFELDKQRINLHEKLILRDYSVDGELVQKLIGLRLVRAEPSSSGGHNVELSHDAFIAPILNAAQKRKVRRWKNIATGLAVAGGLCLLVLLTITFRPVQVPADVVRENQVLTRQLDSIKVVGNLEEEAKAVALKYLEYVNDQNIEGTSSLMVDTLERYYTAKNLPRAKREKLEQQYYKKNPIKGNVKVNEITVEKKDSIYEVVVNTAYLHPTKGMVQVIYRIKLNKALKMYYLRSFYSEDGQ